MDNHYNTRQISEMDGVQDKEFDSDMMQIINRNIAAAIVPGQAQKIMVGIGEDSKFSPLLYRLGIKRKKQFGFVWVPDIMVKRKKMGLNH